MNLKMTEKQIEVTWNEYEWFGSIIRSATFENLSDAKKFALENKHLSNLKLGYKSKFNIKF